uniref:RNA helicase n=1 Tax=Amphilophus citrinellus TaxID=61819 RepID=A0A3Q0RYM4_AMPCI
MASERLDFHEMGLDDRLLKAVADLGWSKPTLIQEKAIPLGLDGKDILARARTGSGKTAAYGIPVIQRILASKQSVREQDVRALILVPTKELGQQVQLMMRQLTAYCSRDVRVADISSKADLSTQRPILMEKPDVVVGTPSRVLAHLNAQNLVLHSSLEMLVVDEADLIFSFGFESDLKNLLCHLPKIYQSFLMSATFTEDVQALKELLLHNPVMSLSHSSPQRFSCETAGMRPSKSEAMVLSQKRVECPLWLRDKLLPQFFCLCLYFVTLFCRCHIITQFNQGFYDYIIATDEQSLAELTTAPQTTTGKEKKKKTPKKGGKEYGVSRGVDFQNVANVINFDFPTTVESYIHRVGRTARADNPGTALSFVSHTELSWLSEVEEALNETDSALKPYEFKMEQIEGFRYRCRDAMRSVTKQAVKEARLKEIKQELLNSEKLKTYFEDNPRDLQLLRHDKDLHPAVVKPHLKNVPEYLIPEALRGVVRPLSSRRRRRKEMGKKPEGVIKSSFKVRCGLG